MVPCKSLLICRKTEAVKYGRTAGSFRASVHSVVACKCVKNTLYLQKIKCAEYSFIANSLKASVAQWLPAKAVQS